MNSMYGIDTSTYGESSLSMNSSLNCSRAFEIIQHGQISYLYDHQLTSTHLHTSECVASFAVLIAHLDMHLHRHLALSVRK